MTIYLDSRTIYLNNGNSLEFEVINFPMGEIHVRLPVGDSIFERDFFADVIWRYRNPQDLIELVLLVNALKNAGKALSTLVIPYLPYSRQDRVAVPGDSFSLKAICEVLDNLDADKIITIDVHSDVAAGCFTRTQFKSYIPADEVLKFVERIHLPTSSFTLIAPDAGAAKRTFSFMKYGFGDFMQCLKSRNPKTGVLDSFQAIGEVKTENALIIDDICDGGGTFIGLGKILKEKGFKKLYLWTTHGGYTKGTDELLKIYERLGCTTSYRLLGESETKMHIKQITLDYTKIIKS